MYADDITLLIAGANEIKVTRTANQVLDSASSWLTSHKLTPNISKTKYMIFSPQPHNIKDKIGVQIRNLLQMKQQTLIIWTFIFKTI